jgi:hypothetical protein
LWIPDGVPLPCFSKVFILKGVKVVCFDALLEVLILKMVRRVASGEEAESSDWSITLANASGGRICGGV